MSAPNTAKPTLETPTVRELVDFLLGFDLDRRINFQVDSDNFHLRDLKIERVQLFGSKTPEIKVEVGF